MEILPKNLGTRPRMAIEIRPEGVVAARAEDATAILTAVAERSLPEGAFYVGLKSGSLVDTGRAASAIREALDAVAARGERTRYVTLIVPDAATRVLLLEFDELPAKAGEALPIVRFRLKKLVPFDVDHAMVSYQVMPSESGLVRVLAVAMPAEVLAEYENAISSAGYITGAVLPSTLATLAALEEQENAALVVNTSRTSVTTAIVRGGTVLLHRALDLATVPAEVGVPVLHGGTEYDRIEAEARIVSEVLQTGVNEQTNAREIAQSVSVAAAYFEDTLSLTPDELISAGTLGADGLRTLLDSHGITDFKVREIVGVDALTADAATRIPRGWLASVRGALRN